MIEIIPSYFRILFVQRSTKYFIVVACSLKDSNLNPRKLILCLTWLFIPTFCTSINMFKNFFSRLECYISFIPFFSILWRSYASFLYISYSLSHWGTIGTPGYQIPSPSNSEISTSILHEISLVSCCAPTTAIPHALFWQSLINQKIDVGMTLSLVFYL